MRENARERRRAITLLGKMERLLRDESPDTVRTVLVGLIESHREHVPELRTVIVVGPENAA